MSNVLYHNIADHPAVAEHKFLMLLNYLVSSKAVRYFSSLKNRIAFGMLSVRSPSLRAEDQNFDRQTWLRKTPGLLPCLLPHAGTPQGVHQAEWTLVGTRPAGLRPASAINKNESSQTAARCKMPSVWSRRGNTGPLPNGLFGF